MRGRTGEQRQAPSPVRLAIIAALAVTDFSKPAARRMAAAGNLG